MPSEVQETASISLPSTVVPVISSSAPASSLKVVASTLETVTSWLLYLSVIVTTPLTSASLVTVPSTATVNVTSAATSYPPGAAVSWSV